MNTEDDWLLGPVPALGFEDEPARERYKYFMRPEPFEGMGPIETEYDILTGREMKYRMIDVGMTRNAENKTERKVYLHPLPHIRIPKAKPLQGWYKAKADAQEGKRPRPCFTDAILTEPYGGYCTVGCAFSLPAGELVNTAFYRTKRIEEIRTGELVWGMLPNGDSELTRVTGFTQHWKPEGLVELTVTGGPSLRMTADHPVYANNTWIAAGELREGDQLQRLLPGISRVLKVEHLPGGVQVYDIQTESENFFHNGILTHNCYINSGSRGYRGSGLITVPSDYGTQVKDMLRTMNTSAAGYFSSFTDPFLPLEDLYHNTQKGAQAFVDAGLPVFFLSRLSYPGWAYDMLKKSRYSYAQKSLNTGNDDDYKKFSPGALSLQQHIDEIRELRRRGIYTSIQVNPIVPGITSHDDIFVLFERLAEVGNNHVIVKFVEAAYSWVPSMVARMSKRFGGTTDEGGRGEAFAALFTQNIGGQRTVAEEYRLNAHRLYSARAKKLGMTYATCYEYKYTADTGKLGVSIGRDFITAEQCHGHKVPMFTRNDSSAPFLEVPDCPPTGCMYCADDNAGKPKCGSETFGAAKALRMPDLKQPVYGAKPLRRVIPIKDILS